MHSNDKLGEHESAALLGIGELPYPTQHLIGKPGLLKDGLGLVTWQLATSLERLALKETSILCHLLGSQGRDADRSAGRLGLEGSWRRRRAHRHGWRRGNASSRAGLRDEAIESRKRSLLESDLGSRFAAGLGVSDES